jgi:hypothetical protein
LWRIQDTRDKEDAAYSDKVAQAQKTIAADDTLSKSIAADIAGFDSLESKWKTLFDTFGSAADAIFSKIPAQYKPTTTSYYIKTLGGYASGTDDATPGIHLVGEQGPELLSFGGGEKVKSTAFLQSIGRSSSPSATGGSTTINVNLGFDSGMSSIFDTEAMARIKSVVQTETARALAKQRTPSDHSASVGAIRMVG